MKKITVAIIAFLYMGLSSGIAMEIHYCLGKKAGFDLYGNNDDKCGKCGMKGKKNGCCNEEHKFYKINDSHKNVSNDLIFGIPDLVVLTTYHAYIQQFVTDAATLAVQNNSPPYYSRPSACILNCVFRL